MDWLDRLADALGEESLSGLEVDRLLQTSREVAHRVERKATPLAAYLVGVAVGKRVAEGASRESACGDAIDAVVVRRPDPPQDAEGG